jgi:hypothetical protein
VFAETLDGGTYWVVDLARRPVEHNIVTVKVTGSPRTTTLPSPDAVASAANDRTWTLPTNLPAKGRLLIRSPSRGTHQLVLDPVPTNATPKEYLSATRLGRDAQGDTPGPRWSAPAFTSYGRMTFHRATTSSWICPGVGSATASTPAPVRSWCRSPEQRRSHRPGHGSTTLPGPTRCRTSSPGLTLEDDRGQVPPVGWHLPTNLRVSDGT